MLVPFSYTRYPQSKLATFLSFIGGLMIAGGLCLAILIFVDGDVEGFAAGVVIALLGFGLNRLAASIAGKKGRG